MIPNPVGASYCHLRTGDIIGFYNSNPFWSYALPNFQAYFEHYKIPTANIFGYDFGTIIGAMPTTWDEINSLHDYIHSILENRDVSGIILGPGTPYRFDVLGETNAFFNPAARIYPGVAPLFSRARRLMEARRAGPNRSLAAQDIGFSGRPNYGVRQTDVLPGAFIPAECPTWEHALGVSDDPVSTSTTFTSQDNIETGLVTGLTGVPPPEQWPRVLPVATRYLGDRKNRYIPVGRVGIASWRSLKVANEAAGNVMLSHISAKNARASNYSDEPAPVLVCLFNVTSPDADIYASLFKRLQEWGISAKYFRRGGSYSSWVNTRCPAGGPDEAFVAADYTSGATINYPVYGLTGSIDNDDMTVTGFGAHPYRDTFAPKWGGFVASLGPSYGYEFGQQFHMDGGAALINDVIHKNSGEHPRGWMVLYNLLQGMTMMEAVFYAFGRTSQAFHAGGDPLFSPFYYLRSASLTSLVPSFGEPYPGAKPLKVV